MRTPSQARVTVAKELRGEKHQAARQMTEHCDRRGNKTTTNLISKQQQQTKSSGEGREGSLSGKALEASAGVLHVKNHGEALEEMNGAGAFGRKLASR